MPVKLHVTIVKRARFTVSGLFAADMKQLGDDVIKNSILKRWDRAQDVYDAEAPPLKSERYRRQKIRRMRAPIRDLNFTGRLRRSMKTLEVSQNHALIGFSDTVTRERMFFNQRRSRMWGMSPTDMKYMQDWVNQRKLLRVVVDGRVKKVA